MKEVLNRDAQAVAEFFDRRYGHAVIAATDNVIHSRLGHATSGRKGIDRNVALLTEFEDSLPHRLSDGNAQHLFLYEYVRKEYRIGLVKVTSFELK